MIKLIILGVLIIVIISFLGYDLQQFVESPVTQKNFSYVGHAITYVWKEYLSTPLIYLWKNVFIDLIWGAFTENMGRVKDGMPTQMQEMAPQLVN